MMFLGEFFTKFAGSPMVATADFAAANPDALVTRAKDLPRPGEVPEEFWVIVADYSGKQLRGLRFRDFWPLTGGDWAHLEPRAVTHAAGQDQDFQWHWAMGQQQYCTAVDQAQATMAAGKLQQVNVTTRLSTGTKLNLVEVTRRIMTTFAPRHGGYYRIPGELPGQPSPGPNSDQNHLGTWQIASASPETFLRWHGNQISTYPIKGTCIAGGDFLAKDYAENRLIVDQVQHDFAALTKNGPSAPAVTSSLLQRQDFAGTSHLESSVSTTYTGDWHTLLAHMLPAASIHGVPRSGASQAIATLEVPGPRGLYCGVFGVMHAGRAELAVGIRSFFQENLDGPTYFGVGAGITPGSTAQTEWQELKLKSQRLIALTDGQVPHG